MNHFLKTILLLGSIALITFSGCKKDEIIIPDNTAPPDSTISTLIIENYVTKCYISLLGREPSSTEENNAIAILTSGNLNVASRKVMLDNIISNLEYNLKLVEYNSVKLLNSPFDTTQIQEQIFVYNIALNDPQYADFVDLIQSVIDNLEILLTTPQELTNGTIGVREMHRRMVFNEIYDQINMGSFNYVLSLFNNFLFRDPTAAEQDAGITMVDGFVAVMFYETGNSKEQFVDIFLGSDDYFEGQVRELFLRYLFREPTSEEQGFYSAAYYESDDYNELQKSILSTDEFTGL
ncbi:MAG: hypothetical protein JKX84_10395 [Flavobacteriales bacterium]|nr:hypothetical protein [Flavobacteriales bacterium]